MKAYKLPEQEPFAMERVGALCRELTDATGLAFVVWDEAGRFWMPVGFSTTLTGLVVGSQALRERMQAEVTAAFESGAAARETLLEGLECLALPVHRRRRTTFVIAAAALSQAKDDESLVSSLATAAGADQSEVRQRLGGENRFEGASLELLRQLVGRLAEEHVQRLDAEGEIKDITRKLSEGYEEITLYQRLASKIRVSQPSDAFFTAVCSELLEFLDVEALAALYRDKNDATSDPRAVTLGALPFESENLLPLYRHFERDLTDGREAVIVNDGAGLEGVKDLVPGVRNMILVPLRQGKALHGVIAAFNKNSGVEFYSTDVKLVASVSGVLGIFVENAHLYYDLQQLMLGTVRAMVSSIDAKDPYTCGHSERVALISRRLAQQLGLPRETIERIYLTGLLHDIGKIGVPERILLKSGRLLPEEFDLMKTHTTIGARILAGVRELGAVIPGVLHHHERLDGRGYPHGLDDKTLPLEGRIIGLADALDAMTSNRVYRAALPLEKVEVEIRRCTGTQFDVHCVDALIEIGITQLLASLTAETQDLALDMSAVNLRRL